MNFFKEDVMKKYSPIILRISLGLVLLWFGANQVLDSPSWVGYLPSFASSLPLSPATLVFSNGAFEIVLGIMLMAGLFTRIIAILASLHLLAIILAVGYNDIAIRDFGIFMTAVAIAFNGPDEWCLDRRFSQGKL